MPECTELERELLNELASANPSGIREVLDMRAGIAANKLPPSLLEEAIIVRMDRELVTQRWERVVSALDAQGIKGDGRRATKFYEGVTREAMRRLGVAIDEAAE